MSEELRAEIIEMVNNIQSIRLLEYLRKFIEKAVTVWK